MIGATVYLGVDPGLQGGLSFYDPVAETLDVYAMPTFATRRKTRTRLTNQIDLYAVGRIIDEQIGWDRKVRAWVELAGVRPQESPRSSFNFGFGIGAIHGILSAHFLPVEIVSASKWKSALSCPADKDGARLRATQLFPKHAKKWPLVKDDGKAESALIALYGSRHDLLKKQEG